jgi:hypothetical protein
MKNFRTLAAALVMGLATVVNAHAGVTVGNYATGNCYPFSCLPTDGGTHYQQVYAAAAFSGGLQINSLSFYKDTGGSMNSASYTLSLSTTSKKVKFLDTSDPANNIGSDNTVLGTFAVSGMMPDVLTFTGSTFNYDPTMGNLLLDVVVSNVISANGYGSFFKATNSDSATSRLYVNSFGTGQDSFGPLVTTFDYVQPASNVPEPMTLATLGLGLAGMAAARRRRKA